VEAIREELRRRIGPTFSAQDLANLYAQGTDCAWKQRGRGAMAAVDLDPQAIVDGAFFAYLRGAYDYQAEGSERSRNDGSARQVLDALETIRSGSIVTRSARFPASARCRSGRLDGRVEPDP